VDWKENVIVKSRFYFSMQHIQSAALFARRSGQIENKYDGNFSNELLAEYWADITASIFVAVSFLEATINELFTDATEEHGEYPKSLDSSTKALMAEAWKKKKPRISYYGVLERFDIALTLAQKPPFERSKLVTDVGLVVQLRNKLVHYKPQWVSDETTISSIPDTEKELFEGLRGKFPTSPLWNGNNYSFFPNKCLSYGCAKWVVESSIAYADNFYAKIGSPAPYEHIRQFLQTN
jgi:hypothetical protein